jgi:pimeloyl-ACP methyl ester carboxylesterase
VGGYPTPELAAHSGRVLSSVAPQVLAQRMRDVIGMDVCDSFARCALPVLYLRGTADRIVPAANQRQLAQLKADMETVTLPCGHMILQDQPERAAAAIHAFLLRHIDAAQSVNDMGGADDSDATRQGDSQHA